MQEEEVAKVKLSFAEYEQLHGWRARVHAAAVLAHGAGDVSAHLVASESLQVMLCLAMPPFTDDSRLARCHVPINPLDCIG